MKYVFFAWDTGIFEGPVLERPDNAGYPALPAGCGVWAFEGDVPDRLRWRVLDGVLVEYQPAAPEATPELEWVWDAGTWRWVAQQTELGLFLGRQSTMAKGFLDEILLAESEQARPLRELVEALLSGDPAQPEAIARFEALKSRINLSRSRYNAVLAAASEADLDAITQIQPV